MFIRQLAGCSGDDHIVSVPLTLPGLVNNINLQIHVGVGTRLQCSTLRTFSVLYPAHETMLDHAILEQETSSDDKSHSGSDEKKDFIRVDEATVA
ncbi:hypothetical protein BC826DRAFT_1178707 [Russula brevipes]|nr:hypothetical protein BC826DRAFT_1178707 [Russula brevipes]